jgi:2-polyprenyl-3-methyl-5-hydroxy-6-metoxy-1,4-benzoquinol methylase
MRLPFSSEEAEHILYSGRIRDGQYGRFSKDPFTIWQFPASQLAFLQPFPTPDYTEAGYRESVNGSGDVTDYFALHDAAQLSHLQLIQPLLTRGMVVADCGCGGGSLLDLVRGRAAETIAIEPFRGFHASLSERGHRVFGSLDDAGQGGQRGRVHLALSFHVIEHTENPISYLEQMRLLLRPGGRAFVLTPNLNDILLRTNFESFAPFFFRVVHNLYFNAIALTWAAQTAGFVVRRVVHHHEFGLANALHWLRDRRPRGDTPMDGIDSSIDDLWRSYLVRSGQSNNVAVELENPD